MSLSEVGKRLGEYLRIYYSVIKYHDQTRWPYSRFAENGMKLVLHPLPDLQIDNDLSRFFIFNFEFDLTDSLDWHFTGNGNARWPNSHYAKINYRPGNPYGDIRINWELNRLQFLPAMAASDEGLARSVLSDWLEKNPYLHGPGYVSSMEVALRWISIYRAVCLFQEPSDESFMQSLTGLAASSGRYIENRLSTHSSAGNHLIVEAVGLFWLGRAVEDDQLGRRWVSRSREIIWEQICKQIHADGSNKEQSFWYLGFVLDALFHYFLLENSEVIPRQVRKRVEKAVEFVNKMTLPDGTFPDYGDRDDGFVFRTTNIYHGSPFPGLITTAACLFDRPDWHKDCYLAKHRSDCWANRSWIDYAAKLNDNNPASFPDKPQLVTYSDGGMTLMKWGKGQLLFRHAPLGFYNTFGHGHADALSTLLFWDNSPVLIDLGSGQYNGDQKIRNFFRSTIAHNTVEIGQTNQARILGPFLWQKTYETRLNRKGETPRFFVEASHNGYLSEFGVIHKRLVEWRGPRRIEISDNFIGPGGKRLRGAFHLAAQSAVFNEDNTIEADFVRFILLISFPSKFSVQIFRGSHKPFMGWRAKIYGELEPIFSIIFSSTLTKDCSYSVALEIVEP